MSYKIEEIEGIGPQYAKRLEDAGIKTTDDMLHAGETPAGRKKLAETTEISASLILRWVNHADLFRVKGVAGQFAELLEAAGVDTVKELGHRVPANLHAKLERTNEEKHLVHRVPSLSEVEKMVAQAKELPAAVKY